VGGAFKSLQTKGLIVQGLEGSCDLSPQHPARVAEAGNTDDIQEISIDPKALGLSNALDVRAVGADPARCAALTRDAFERRTSEEATGAVDAIALNAGILLWRAGIASDAAAGVQKARNAIASGAAVDRMSRTISDRNPNS